MANQRITLTIDCHRIPLQVKMEDEHLYRKAARTLNEVYSRYSQRLPQASVEELWVYTALHLAVNLHSDIRDKDLKPVMDKIAEINLKIKNSLKED